MGCGYAKFSTTKSCLRRNLKLDDLEILNNYLNYLIEQDTSGLNIKFYMEPLIYKLTNLQVMSNFWEMEDKSIVLKMDKILLKSIIKNILLLTDVPIKQKECLNQIIELKIEDPSYEDCITYMNHVKDNLIHKLNDRCK